MRIAPIASLAVSIALGVAAVFVGRSWLAGQAESSKAEAASTRPAPVDMSEVLVAREDVETGGVIDAMVVQAAPWPTDAVPAGALRNSGDLVRLFDGEAFANGFIARGEPILAAKLSSDPIRSILSADIAPGKRAVSIRVGDVTGVAGFVLPGDRVDVNLVLTEGDAESISVDPARLEAARTIQPVLENVRVLGVDQLFQTNLEGAALSKTVTLEVTPDQAKALAAAGRLGVLTLALIGQEEVKALQDEEDVVAEAEPKPRPAARPATTAIRRPAPAKPKTANVRVINGDKEQTVQTPAAPAETESS